MELYLLLQLAASKAWCAVRMMRMTDHPLLHPHIPAVLSIKSSMPGIALFAETSTANTNDHGRRPLPTFLRLCTSLSHCARQ